jgi:hypothetical protein
MSMKKLTAGSRDAGRGSKKPCELDRDIQHRKNGSILGAQGTGVYGPLHW